MEFGKYVLERRIAVGGTSEVYLARLKVTGKDGEVLVIKRLLPAFLVDPAALGMFATEARLHRAISHPNVVKIHEAGVVDGEPYLAMEYIDGVDAAHLCRRARVEQRPIPPGLAVYVARAVCDALASVHSAKDANGAPLAVMHRDVTPSNLYLSATGLVRLGDFGIARTGTGRPSRASLGAGIKGKYGYLSPEQVCGESCDHRSDLFSLAVVLCEMLLGKPLFPGSGQLAVLLAIRDGRIDALRAAKDSLPAGLFDVLAKALAREPADRYGTAAELSAALEPFEVPSREQLVRDLAELVAWVRDTSDLARRLQGAIKESGQRLVTLSTIDDDDDDAPTTPRAGSTPADEAKTLPKPAKIAPPVPPALPSDDPPTRPREASPPRTAPPPQKTEAPPPTVRRGPVNPAESFRDAEPVTARFDERPSLIRFADGEQLGPIAFARIIEMIVTGQLGPDDQVDLMGQGLRRVAQIELLERHLPDAATTRSVRTPGPPDESHDLATTPLLSILGQLAQTEKTGFLLIEGKPPGEAAYARREVYLKGGTLHHVGTNDVSELLGQSLVRRGMISNAELDMALAVLSKFEGRLGDTLVALGLLDAMDLFRAIEEQGKERLARVFGWSEGRTTFYREVLPARVEFPLELELADVMLAGLEVAQPSDAPVTMFKDHLSKRLRRAKREGAKRRVPLPKPVVLFLDTLGAGMELRQVMMRLSTTGALSAAEALRAMQVAIALGLVDVSLGSMVSSRLLGWTALLVPVLGLAELGLSLAFARSAPTPADWAASRQRVAALRAQADGVVVSPWWAEPHARRAYGDSILPLRDVARPDETRYRTLVEVSARGDRLPETSSWRVRSEETLAHGLVARVLENPAPVTLVTDFVARAETGRGMSVVHAFPDREEPCPWSDAETVIASGLFGHPTLPRSRFACGRYPWLSVGVTVHDDERHRARRCIWSHPPQGGEVRIRFSEVPLGGVVRGHLSIHWTLEREKRGTPVDLDVDVDGERIGTAHHEDGDGWRAFELPLGAHAGTTARDVTFHVRSVNANERHVCWEADSR